MSRSSLGHATDYSRASRSMPHLGASWDGHTERQASVSHHSSASRRMSPHGSAHDLAAGASNGTQANQYANPTLMEAGQIIEILKKKIAFLSGGRDRHGGAIITFPNHGEKTPDFPPQELTATIAYLCHVPSEDTSSNGFTLVIDNRHNYWRSLKSLLRLVQQAIPVPVNLVCVVKNEQLLDRQKLNLSFRKDKKSALPEPHFMSISKLQHYIGKSQLTAECGGTLLYDHEQWLQNRMSVEKFLREARAVAHQMDAAHSEITQHMRRDEKKSPRDILQQHRHLYDTAVRSPEKVIKQGQGLLRQLQNDSDSGFRKTDSNSATLDNMASQRRIQSVLGDLESKVDSLQSQWEMRDRQISNTVQFADLELGKKKKVPTATLR